MNLVKAQEYAASLPLAELKKYADGLNPSMIPPWLATGEMQAKTKRAEMLNNLQGAAQGEQPSVKEQVEKQAGLMALQQMQKAQQQAQPAPTGGPIPEGAPQPNPQPEPEAGLDQLQSNIELAGGGIVAFAKGDQVKVSREFLNFLKQMGIDYVEYSNMAEAAKAPIQDAFKDVKGTISTAPPQAAPAAAQTVQGSASPKAFAAGQAMRPAMDAAKNIAKTKLLPGANIGIAAAEGLSDISGAQDFYDDPNVSMADKAKQFARTGARTALPIAGGTAGSFIAPVAGTIGGAAVGQGLAALIDQEGDALKKYREAKKGDMASENARLAAKAPAPDMGNEGRRTGQVAIGVNPNTNQNAVPANLRVKPPANLNPAAPKPPAAPAVPASTAPAPDSYEAMLRDSLKNSPKERSIESIIAEQNAIDKALGLDVPAGKDKLERIAAIKEQYAATQMTPMQELIAMFGQSGQYKGLSGLAPAYTSMEAQKREAGLKHAKDINELMGGVEDAQRLEKTATKTKVGTAREKDIENARLFDRDKMSTLGNVRGQDVQAASSKYNADMHYKAAMAQMSNANARQDAQEKRLLLDSFKTRISSIDKELAPLLKMPFGPAKEQIAALQAEKAGLTRALDETSGIGKITGAPGAASPGGTTRMRFDAQGNPIK